MSINSAFRSIKVLGIGLLAMAYAGPSHAYIDPGTGSIILQSILAGVAVAIGMLRMFWYRLKAFFISSDDAGRDTDRGAELDYPQDADTRKEP